MSPAGDHIEIEHEDPYPSGFTQIDNRDIWDRCNKDRKLLLRPATLGVYTAMRSLPKGWKFHESWLTQRLGIGRDALRRTIRDLEVAKRLSRRVVRDERGRYVRTVWRLLRPESPLTENPSMVAACPLTDSQSLEVSVPLTDFPTTENSTAGEPAPLVTTERDIEERTTTTNGLNWEALPQLDSTQRVVVVDEIECLDPNRRQDVLDELAGAFRFGTIKKGWSGWLDGVVKKAREGRFKPNLALVIQSERKRQRGMSQQERREHLGLPPVARIASREVAEAAMEAIRSGLSTGDST